jgi:hypothetical protein
VHLRNCPPPAHSPRDRLRQRRRGVARPDRDNFPFHSTISFARTSDSAQLTLSDISVTFAVPSTVSAVVDGDTAHPITLLSFVPLPGEIMTDGHYLIAHDFPLILTDAGACAFATVFGTNPVPERKALFIGTESGQLEVGAPLVPALG